MLEQPPYQAPTTLLSLHCGLTLGQLTFIFNVLLIIAQYLLLNKQERKQQIYNIIMQVPITVPFCLAIDLGMFILRNFLPEEFAYPFHPGTTYNRNMCFSFRHYFSGYCRRFYGLWRIFRKNSSSKKLIKNLV